MHKRKAETVQSDTVG